MVLQRLYHRSDEATQIQILDRLSFQRFLGLSLSDPVPNRNTIRELLEALRRAEAFQCLFEVFNTHLAGQGLLPREGVIVDATFVEVPRQRNTREENTLIKEGKTPEDWTKKNEQTFYGYKDHIKVKQKTKFIEAAVVTAASVHDNQTVLGPLQSGDGVVYGDSC